MSINADIAFIEKLDNGDVRFHLSPHGEDGPGQPHLTLLQPKRPIPLNIGDHIWGHSELILFRDAPLYHRASLMTLTELVAKTLTTPPEDTAQREE